MLFEILQVLAVILAALAMVPAAAHALELPGKMRLHRSEYIAVQSIYYPGFTLAGIGEAASIPATFVLLLLTPRHTASFWLTLGALLGLLAVHTIFWFVTQPVNRAWIGAQTLGGVGARFFSVGAEHELGRDRAASSSDWSALRDRWEHSHVLRAALAATSFVSLVIAVVMSR
jgi:hypothetical protein